MGLDRSIGPGPARRAKSMPIRWPESPSFPAGCSAAGRNRLPVGPLPVAGCRSLVLVTEWAGEDRPREAYPLDIGGHVDWLMPLVTVEADDASYCQSLRRFVPGWATVGPCSRRRLPRARLAPLGCRARVLVAGPLRRRRAAADAAAHASPGFLRKRPCGADLRSPGDAPLPKIDLRVERALAPATRQPEDDNRVKTGPLPGQPATARAAAPRARARPALSGSPTNTASQYQSRTMRWDLQRYRGRAVQLTLSLVLDKQVEGLAWRELTTMPNGKP